MKKTIAVIGAGGAMGSALSQSLAASGHHILLMDKDSEKCHKTYDAIFSELPNANIEILNCIHEGSWEADVIIPAVAYEVQEEVADYIKDVVTGKIVISIINPLNEDKSKLLTSPFSSAAEELQKYLPYSKVVKAFNTIFPSDFKNQMNADCFLAGDDEIAVATVSALIKESGMVPQLAGNLSTSRTLESMMLILIQLCRRNNTPESGCFKIHFSKS
ncbi:MAG: NAD(P)-binding domain-containing protein [Sporocytophaga sp.]|uniref:NADPH-dependent F420 reductase n=1 Tax=Sporocytophaga sp. TaxID=2231183 RepID=UPI001B0B10B1|nr:NAD(P)-binding domain-containing protein [Sporocytophaga sp.]MBO9703388.1 NAD(P)-binding domain-containing protein [Sporocytophaga sp.]